VGPVLCLVTDRARCGGEDHLVAIVRQAAAAGVQLVQVRERDLEARVLCRLVGRCVAAVSGTRTRVLVNDRADVALAAGAHGVHLPSFGVPAPRLRAMTPPGFLIGRSVHGLEEAQAAEREGGLDFLVFGTVFASSSKPGVSPAGLETLRTVAAAVPLPVLAIGGVTPGRMGMVRSAGAAGFAAIALFADAVSSGPDALHILVAHAARAFDTPGTVP
jgi:thiamine-phosphate pyrophosphorylase